MPGAQATLDPAPTHVSTPPSCSHLPEVPPRLLSLLGSHLHGQGLCKQVWGLSGLVRLCLRVLGVTNTASHGESPHHVPAGGGNSAEAWLSSTSACLLRRQLAGAAATKDSAST